MSNNKNTKNTSLTKGESGFTLIEAVCAIFVVTIGLIGTAAAVTYALEFSAISRNVTSAKSVIISTFEEIETLRNARRLEFGQIANVGAVNNTGAANPFGGFSTGFQAISNEPGADGVNGSQDDFTAPGADGTYGTPDDYTDLTRMRGGYDRQIEITRLSDTLKKIQVTVQYVGRAGKVGEISGVFYLNDEARVTR
jgi:type II secretory pathway pseudopilin PulG